MKSALIKHFASAIVDWDKDIDRGMPWQGEQDPYLVWLSEILLQQTRVEQGLPYYLKFKEAYPTVIDLADAADDEVMRLWQGLGYYSRCRNLLFTARMIRDEMDGKFPDTYESILKLKGVGPYTAAAIASFAFGIQKPVVDGNVKRVISRVFGIEEPIDTKEGNIQIEVICEKAISFQESPAVYNQAIMNFGAIHCSPKKPNCTSCPLANDCYAWKMNKTAELPRKSKKIKKKSRFFIYLHICYDDQLLIHQRNEKDVWQGLYQLPLIEVSEKEFLKFKLKNSHISINLDLNDLERKGQFGGYKQQLTHQRIHAQYLKFSTDSRIEITDKNYLWVEHEQLNNYAFPKIVLDYLTSDQIQGQLPI